MIFQEMDPVLARKLLEGYHDELTPEHKTQEEFYSKFKCPRCRCSLGKEFDSRTAFTNDAIIPKAILRCSNCGYAIDPHTNVIIAFGDASKIPVELIPILGH